ncbi:MAG TPA: adenylate/guanylate cyclase domain-containing protein [Gaiellaceae bacterium]|nr:adenylate/guanylate cyclase domain-containing protein [Gaiellaceae bacterium]
MTVCASCGRENREGRKFCAGCGQSLAVELTCPSCGTPYEQDESFCGECGTALGTTPAAASAAVAPVEAAVAERRLVSVLFADLVGFTTLSESRDPEEVRELLSRYFDTCRRLVELYGGVVEKFIGDAVMAVWGTPVATEDDAERAVRTALDLIAAVQALGQEAGIDGLRARAGVLTGEAAVNTAAVGEGMVAGDLVNTASRVQSVAEPGSVFVGDATRRATEGTVVYESAGSFELKGKEGETPLWQARRVVSGRAGSLKSEGLEAPFVGRDRELRQIKDLFHVCAEEGRAHLVSITGIAGIGKSRLAWEFYKYFDGIVQTIYWHRGRCLAYGEGVTYWALADMVRWRCGIAEDEEPEEALQKLRAALEEHLLDPEERGFVEPRLAQLLALRESASHDRQDLFAAWRLFFERLADTYPTILAFEDMQWADASLLDFVEYLLEWSRDKPLFVVTLARPELLEKRPTWGAGHRNFSSLYLEPLAEQAMQELLLGLVPGLPPSLRNQILARAEGVPLYAVETVRMLLDRGLLVQDGSACRVVGEVETLEVPETLHALIAARLDGLSPDERRLLGDAAVLGKTFTPQALAALSGHEADALNALLTTMVRREVLGLQSDPRSPEQGQYTFLQDLLRHVAYETLPKRERREKHLAAAEHLAATLGEDEVAEVIASHLLDAYRLDPDGPDAETLRGKAHQAALQAGDRAVALGAPSGAQHYFEQAAELARQPLEKAEALVRAGEMAMRVSELEQAGNAFERAISLYEDGGDTHAAARATGWRAMVDANLGRYDEAIDRMERACAVIDDGEPDADLALLLTRLGQSYFFHGNVQQASERTERALDLGEALELSEVLARGWNTRGLILSGRRPEEARGLFQLAFDMAMAHERYSLACSITGQLSDLAFRRDRYVDSLGYLDRMLALARRIGHRGYEWFALSEMTYALTMLGRWDEALARLGEIPDETLGTDPQVISPLTGVLDIYLHRGEVDTARKLLSRYAAFEDSSDVQAFGSYQEAAAAVRFAEGEAQAALTAAGLSFDTRASHGISAQNVKCGFVQAVNAALSLGDHARADALVAVVEEHAPGLRGPFLDAIAHRFRARLAGGDPGADRHFTTAAAQLRALELPFHLGVVQLEHAEWLTARGRPDDSQPLLAEARDTFERLRAAPWLERVDAVVPGTSAEVLA